MTKTDSKPCPVCKSKAFTITSEELVTFDFALCWLQAALKCKEFKWEGDQRYLAQESLRESLDCIERLKNDK